MRQTLFRAIYFAIQKARNGVSPSLIERVAELLNGSADNLNLHIAQGLQRTHAAPVNDAIGWLEAQPLLSRQELVTKLSTAPRSRNRRVEWKRTSGSTGTPIRLPRDMEMSSWIDATMWALYSWHGVRPGDPHARFWGPRRGRLRHLATPLASQVLNRTSVSAFKLDPTTARRHYERMLRRRIVYFHGYPSAIGRFADLLADQGLSGSALGVRIIFSTGEMLSETTRRRLEFFFACRVVNEYGCSESGLIGFECEAGTMHTIPITCYPELVDPSGLRVRPGEAGEVIVTDLVGRSAPLLRYRLHDRGLVPSPAECRCARALPISNIAQGRVSSFVLLASGRQVYSACIAYAMPQGVRCFRARQRTLRDLEILVVPDPNVEWAQIETGIRTGVRAHLGDEVWLSIRAVTEIRETDGSGKLRYFEPLEHNASGSESTIR
jgi:phenylacetate-CoA ligase